MDLKEMFLAIVLFASLAAGIISNTGAYFSDMESGQASISAWPTEFKGEHPLIYLVIPTPENGSNVSGSIFINFTSDMFLEQAIMEFDGADIALDEPSLVLNMHFDEGEGLTAYDDSRYNNNGAISGASWINGMFGGGLLFDGNSYVSIADESTLRQDEFTIEGWVYRKSGHPENQAILAKNNSYGIYAYGTEGFSFYGNMNGLPVFVDSEMPEGKWMHFAVSYNSTDVSLYMNGAPVKVQAVSGDVPYDSSPLVLGADQGHFFNGSIDELKMYSLALSAEEIAQHYNMTFGTNYANITNIASGIHNFTIFGESVLHQWGQSEERAVYAA